MAELQYDHPDPHCIAITATLADIDELGHVNNAVYVRWLTDCAWSHSRELGMDMDAYRKLDRAMAMTRHEIDYLAPALVDDELQVATWIREYDDRLTMARRFQVVRPRDRVTLLRARTTFACIELSTGRPRRMPAAFREAYGGAYRRQQGDRA